MIDIKSLFNKSDVLLYFNKISRKIYVKVAPYSTNLKLSEY